MIYMILISNSFACDTGKILIDPDRNTFLFGRSCKQSVLVGVQVIVTRICFKWFILTKSVSINSLNSREFVAVVSIK